LHIEKQSTCTVHKKKDGVNPKVEIGGDHSIAKFGTPCYDVGRRKERTFGGWSCI